MDYLLSRREDGKYLITLLDIPFSKFDLSATKHDDNGVTVVKVTATKNENDGDYELTSGIIVDTNAYDGNFVFTKSNYDPVVFNVQIEAVDDQGVVIVSKPPPERDDNNGGTKGGEDIDPVVL